MKFYLVVFVNTEESCCVTTKGCYESKAEAEDNLIKHALDYVKSDGGERQEKIALQNEKSIEDIKVDTSLNFGLYLKEENNGDIKIVRAYEKYVEDTGTWRSYMENFIKEKGLFRITDIDFSVPERYSCGCNVKKTTTSSSQSTVSMPPITFLDEYKKLLDDGGNFNLKSAKKSKNKLDNSGIQEVTSVIDEIKKIAEESGDFGLRPTKIVALNKSSSTEF